MTTDKAMVTDAMVEAAAEAYWMEVYGQYRKWKKWPDDVHGRSEQLFRDGCRAALSAALTLERGEAEPVAGYRRRLPQYSFEHFEFEQPGYENPNLADWEPLYSSTLSKRGEAEETPAPEIERLRAALSVAWVRMRNARGAVESNQVIDKDVRGTLTRGIEEIDAVLSHIPSPAPEHHLRGDDE